MTSSLDPPRDRDTSEQQVVVSVDEPTRDLLRFVLTRPSVVTVLPKHDQVLLRFFVSQLGSVTNGDTDSLVRTSPVPSYER